MTKNEKLMLEKLNRVRKVKLLLLQLTEMQTYVHYEKIPFDYRSMAALQLLFLNTAVDASAEIFEEKLLQAKSHMANMELMLKDAKMGRWS